MKDKNFQVLEILETLPKITTKRTLKTFPKITIKRLLKIIPKQSLGW